MWLLMPAEFEQPVDAMCGGITLPPKGVSKDSMSNRTHCTDGTTMGIGLVWMLEGISCIHQLPPKPLIASFLEALQNFAWGGGDTRRDH